jgi:hypothetical protein
MEARRLGFGHSWMWIKQGIWLFKRNPFILMTLTAMLVVGMFGIALFPILGALLPGLLYPAFFAGLMLGCHALAGEKPLELKHLFAGFQTHGASLISLGALSTLLNLIVGTLVIWAAGGEAFLLNVKHVLEQPDPEAMTQAINTTGIMLPMFMLMLVSAALQFIVQFAALLIVFRAVRPLAALIAAMRATLLNTVPLLAYGLMLLPFAFIASVPLMLGWLVLFPIIVASQYAIYRDMYPMQEDLRRAADKAERAGE